MEWTILKLWWTFGFRKRWGSILTSWATVSFQIHTQPHGCNYLQFDCLQALGTFSPCVWLKLDSRSILSSLSCSFSWRGEEPPFMERKYWLQRVRPASFFRRFSLALLKQDTIRNIHLKPVVTICTTRFNVLPTRCIYVSCLRTSEQTAFISLNSIKLIGVLTETVCVYCAVRAEYIKTLHELRP